MTPGMPKPATRPDLLVRFENLKPPIGAFQFEALHNLPQNLIGKMRMGMYNTAASNRHMNRFEAAIERYEHGDTSSLPDDLEPVMGRPKAVQNLDEDAESLVAELELMIENSQDIAQVDQCNKKLTKLILRGIIPDGTGRVLKELLSERRQSLHAKQEREEKARAGKELKIVVIHVPNWTGGMLPTEMPSAH